VTVVGLAVAGPDRVIPGAEDDIRNLLLNAAGTRALKTGQVRVPVSVDGVEYEVVVTQLGEPRIIPVPR
jgi:hypothetical protein